MMIVDGSNHVLGRLASIVAKKLLKGEQVFVVNVEKIVVVGKKDAVMEKWERRQGLTTKGNQERNPKFPRMPDRLVKYTVRGMLPFPKMRGRIALKKFKAFIGMPRELQGKPVQTLEKALHKERQSSMTVGEISSMLGAKW